MAIMLPSAEREIELPNSSPSLAPYISLPICSNCPIEALNRCTRTYPGEGSYKNKCFSNQVEVSEMIVVYRTAFSGSARTSIELLNLSHDLGLGLGLGLVRFHKYLVHTQTLDLMPLKVTVVPVHTSRMQSD